MLFRSWPKSPVSRWVSLELGWLPVQGYKRIADGVGPWLVHLTLPAITLSVIYIALIARVTRASVLETLGEDYIRTARAKGLPEGRVLLHHALANAAVPIATVIGIGIALLIGGVVVTESVYAIPGLGRLTVDAVLARDFPTIQGVILLFSFVYVGIEEDIGQINQQIDPHIDKREQQNHADWPASGAHAVAGTDHHHAGRAGGSAAGRVGGLAAGWLAGPVADGIFSAGLFGAHLRAGLFADLVGVA